MPRCQRYLKTIIIIMFSVKYSVVDKTILRAPILVKRPNTTLTKFANTVDPDETAHYEQFHLDLQCLPYCL